MKKRAITIILVSLTIILATYTLEVINFASSYYDKPNWITFTSYFLFYTLPFLIICTFFIKLIKIVAGVTSFVLLLDITFGIYLLGKRLMSSEYLIITSAHLISIIYLIFIIYNNNQEKLGGQNG